MRSRSSPAKNEAPALRFQRRRTGAFVCRTLGGRGWGAASDRARTRPGSAGSGTIEKSCGVFSCRRCGVESRVAALPRPAAGPLRDASGAELPRRRWHYRTAPLWRRRNAYAQGTLMASKKRVSRRSDRRSAGMAERTFKEIRTSLESLRDLMESYLPAARTSTKRAAKSRRRRKRASAASRVGVRSGGRKAKARPRRARRVAAG